MDARQINSLATGPFCRPRADCVPLAFLNADISKNLPALSLPRTDWEAHLPDGIRPAFSSQCPFQESTKPCGTGLVICGFRRPLRGEDKYYKTYPKPSELIWVCDGVIVSRESIGISTSVAALVILSAKSLETDLTGFELRHGDDFRNRRREGLRAAGRELKALQIQGGITTKGRSSIKSLLGWGGIVFGVLVPPAGLALLSMRLLSMNSEHRSHAKEFDRRLGQIQRVLEEARER